MCFTYLSNSSVKVLLDAFIKAYFQMFAVWFNSFVNFTGGCRGPNIFNVIRGPRERQPLNEKAREVFSISSFWVIKKVCPHYCNFCRAILFPVIDNSITRSSVDFMTHDNRGKPQIRFQSSTFIETNDVMVDLADPSWVPPLSWMISICFWGITVVLNECHDILNHG